MDADLETRQLEADKFSKANFVLDNAVDIHEERKKQNHQLRNDQYNEYLQTEVAEKESKRHLLRGKRENAKGKNYTDEYAIADLSHGVKKTPI